MPALTEYEKHEPPAIRALWQQFRRTKDPLSRQALIEHYDYLVGATLSRLASDPPPDLTREDLAQTARAMGLIRAVDTFEPERGKRFRSHAIPKIRGAILEVYRTRGWQKRSGHDAAARLRQAAERLEQRGEAVTDEGLAKELRPPKREWNCPPPCGQRNPAGQRACEACGALTLAVLEAERRAAFAPSVVSLESGASSDDGEGGSLLDLVAGDPGDLLAQQEQMDRDRIVSTSLAAALSQLPPRQRRMVTQHLLAGRPLQEVAREMHLSYARTRRQFYPAAIARLKRKLGADNSQFSAVLEAIFSTENPHFSDPASPPPVPERPVASEQVNVMFDPSTRRRLARLAEALAVSEAEALRRLVRAATSKEQKALRGELERMPRTLSGPAADKPARRPKKPSAGEGPACAAC